ncbi:type II toxin-antitoxin system RelE family toxin [Okibacterium endophyticum]
MNSDGAWRIRVGDHRVIYDIEDDRLLVLALALSLSGSPREIYR